MFRDYLFESGKGEVGDLGGAMFGSIGTFTDSRMLWCEGEFERGTFAIDPSNPEGKERRTSSWLVFRLWFLSCMSISLSTYKD